MPDNEIIRLIEKIRNRYDRIYGPTGNLVRIEADQLLADIRELYEKLSSPALSEVLPETNKLPLEETEIQHIEESAFEVADEPLKSPRENREPEDIAEPVLEFKPSTIEAFPEPIADFIPEDEVIEEKQPAARPHVEFEPPSAHKEFHRKSITETQGLDLFGAPLPTLADKLGEEKRSVNEKLHSESSSDKSIGLKLRQPVTDLMTAIGINDRFHFINELFEGDMRVYDEMLTKLNTCGSLQPALEYFERTKISRGWTDELESVNKLLDFIHRRYA
jgi:hypothetical protein